MLCYKHLYTTPRTSQLLIFYFQIHRQSLNYYDDIDNISHRQRERACALDIVEFTSVRVIEAEDFVEAMWAYIRKYESDFASYSSGTIHAR